MIGISVHFISDAMYDTAGRSKWIVIKTESGSEAILFFEKASELNVLEDAINKAKMEEE